MAYKNHEGYNDPTLGAVLAKCMTEYHMRQKENRKRQQEIISRPKVYVASRYAGDVEKNVAQAIRFCQFVIRKGRIPVASHLLYPQMLRDDVPEERELGTGFGLALLAVCDEVWILNDGSGLSAGVLAEEREAKRLGKPVRYFNPGAIS